MSGAEPTFWSHDDGAEELYHSDQDDAIRDHLDSMLSPGCGDVLKELPTTIKVYGYTRRRLAENEPAIDPDMIVERIFEDLDGEYNSPHDSNDEAPHAAILEAAKALCAAVREHYPVWACERTREETIDVAAWVREHEPEWLQP